MRRTARHIGFPLLAKELYEQAQRPGTYFMRVLFGGLMFATMAVSLYQLYQKFGTSIHLLGNGPRLLETIVMIETVVVLLFVPAMVGPCVAGETERKTLPLLLITGLRPWQILSQKLLSRLIPIASFLLLVAPMLNVAYLLGGVTMMELLSSIAWLITLLVAFSVVCLFISVTSESSIGAQVKCFVVGPFALGAIVAANLYLFQPLMIRAWNSFSSSWLTGSYVFRAGTSLYSKIIVYSVSFFMEFVVLGPIWIASILLFWVSCGSLRRKVAEPDATLTFPRIKSGGQPVTRPLPTDQPIAWLHRYTGSAQIGSYTWMLAFAIAIVVLWLIGSTPTSVSQGVFVGRLSLGVWVCGVTVLVMQASGAFAIERTQQSLSILMTTPLSGREMIEQRMVSIRRWMWFVGIAILAMALWRFASMVISGGDTLKAVKLAAPALFAHGLGVVIVLPLLMWSATALGLLVDSHEKATSLTVTAIAAWLLAGAAFPMFLLGLFDVSRAHVIWGLTLASPATLIVDTVMPEKSRIFASHWLPLWVNYLVYGGLRSMIRGHVLNHADEYLGRAIERKQRSTKVLEPKSPGGVLL